MSWIRVDQSVVSHRKTLTLADELDIHEAQAIGHLVALWAWVYDNAQDGRLPNNDRMIARVALWDEDPSDFVRALVLVGFLDDDFAGNRTIHDWDHYAKPLIQKQQNDRERAKKWRERQKSA